MTAQEIRDRMQFLQREIPRAEEALSHKINRRMELKTRPAKNEAFRKKLLQRYRLEIIHDTDYINNLKTELWGLQEVNLPGI